MTNLEPTNSHYLAGQETPLTVATTGGYGPATTAAGGVAVRLSRHGGSAINLLDPRILTTSSDDADSARVGHDRLLEMVSQFARRELSSQEQYAPDDGQACPTGKGI